MCYLLNLNLNLTLIHLRLYLRQDKRCKSFHQREDGLAYEPHLQSACAHNVLQYTIWIDYLFFITLFGLSISSYHIVMYFFQCPHGTQNKIFWRIDLNWSNIDLLYFCVNTIELNGHHHFEWTIPFWAVLFELKRIYLECLKYTFAPSTSSLKPY